MRRRILIGISLILFITVSAGRSEAREVRQGDQCTVAANETIAGNLFTLCRSLIINGRIEGNLMGAATKSEINGSVAGDVYLLSGQLDVNGIIGGDLHFGGGVLRILPPARFTSTSGDLISASLSTTLSKGATIPGSITALGYQLILEGNVGKDVNFWGSALTIEGSIGGNVDATVGDPQSTGISQLQTLLIPFSWDVNLIPPGLVVGPNAEIAGTLHYSGPVRGTVEGAVTGETIFTQVVAQPDLTQIITEEQGAQRGLGIYISQALREFVALTIVGGVGLFIIPRPLQTPVRIIQTRPLPSMGIGLLTFIVAFPIVFIALLLIIILVVILLLLQLDGLLLGLATGSVLSLLLGFALAFFFVAIFVSRVIVCLWAGRALVRAFMTDTTPAFFPFLSLIVGVSVLALLSPLPVIGWIINALALFLGLGAIVIAVQGQFRAYRDTPAGLPPRARPAVSSLMGNSRRLPPPILDDQPKGVGMDNLPDGFSWWDD